MQPRIDTKKLFTSIPRYAQPESIVINNKVIAEICQLARVEALTIVTFSEEETKSEVSGVNSDMTASGKAYTQITPNKKSSKGGQPTNIIEVAIKGTTAATVLNIETNFTEEELSINTRGLETSGENLRNTENWAKHLNSEIKKELFEIIIQKLLTFKIIGLIVDILEIFYLYYMTGVFIYTFPKKGLKKTLSFTGYTGITGVSLTSIQISLLTLALTQNNLNYLIGLLNTIIFSPILTRLDTRNTIKKFPGELQKALKDSGNGHYSHKDLISFAGIEPVKLLTALYKLYTNDIVQVKKDPTPLPE
jgi:hypothetical protein